MGTTLKAIAAKDGMVNSGVMTEVYTPPAGTAPTLTSESTINLFFGVGGSFQVTATGNPVPTFTLSGAPRGVTIDARTGRITIAATNGVNPDATQTFTLTVMIPMAAPVIMSPNSTNIVYGEGGTFQVSASGNPAPTYSLSGAPSGVTIHPDTGLITIGGKVKAGKYTFTITAKNGIEPDAKQTFTLTVGKVSDVPKTGDDFPFGWLMLAFVGLVLGAILLLRKAPRSRLR